MATDATKVKAITGSKLEDSAIDPFIPPALCMIDEAAECADVTDDCKDLAHTYLTAHLLVTSAVGRASAQLKKEKLEDVYDVTYAANAGEGTSLLSTTYGTTANMLMKGCLADLGKTQPILEAIGSC